MAQISHLIVTRRWGLGHQTSPSFIHSSLIETSRRLCTPLSRRKKRDFRGEDASRHNHRHIGLIWANQEFWA